GGGFGGVRFGCREDHVVIIGAGVIGAACAHYLVHSGWKVTIVVRKRFGSGCSHANCGFVCPSHVLPLAMPGAVSHTLRSLLKRDSPFRVRPGLRWSLWRWLWASACRCNRADMLESGHAIQPLLTSSRSLYDQLIREG